MSEPLRVGWAWSPSVVIGFAIWTWLYLWYCRTSPTSPGRQIAFHVGTLVGLLALVSPLDELGDHFLFSAHMVQHLLLIFVTAPLWLLGAPGHLVDRVVPEKVAGLVSWLIDPKIAFFIFVGVLYFWHFPPMYNFAQESETVHILEHLTFIGAALIVWWPVAGAETSRLPRPAPALRMLYLFLLALPCTFLAAVLTFAHEPLYSFYVNAPHSFGLDPVQDQRLGGLLMWLPTHLFLLLAIGITFFKWFTSDNREARWDNMEKNDHAGDSLRNDLQEVGV
jgi:cytochrome c oxidase assembly factor CtaG